MRILIVNDDGINAMGIRILAKRLSKDHEVTVVAPETERSAASHCITMNRPLRVSKVEQPGFEEISCYTVDGMPVDCTKVGIVHVMKKEADLVVSGINHGSNMGSDVLYSGTVSAALDAVIMGYPALAVSLASSRPKNFESAAEIASALINKGLYDKYEKGTLYNLNVPDLPLKSIKGLKVTRQGRTVYRDEIEVRRDPRGNEYIWVTGNLEDSSDTEDTDVSAVRNGYASITPLKYDLTYGDKMKELALTVESFGLKF